MFDTRKKATIWKPMKKYAGNSRQHGYDWWSTWRPDYEGWLQCADSLYAPQAIINAIGGEQKYCDYRTSMKYQRDRCTMEMGPLLQAIANGDTVAFVYEMYLTPKGMENALPLR